MSASTRFPIKEPPLRLPGQSLQEERQKLLDNDVGTPLVLALVMFGVVIWEWWRYLTGFRVHPIVVTGFGLLVVAYAVWRVVRLRGRLRSLRLAIQGERTVGQFLESLREDGYRVFHDVLGNGFNVDHILIGPSGAYTVETKTWSKPTKGEPTLEYDGYRISALGYSPDRDPIVQAKAQANWLRQLLHEMTGREIPVRPVVLFPGWFIRQSAGSMREVWVLEPKALPKFLANEESKLSEEHVASLAYNLSRYIRNGEAKGR
ncbi:MAG: NERD domain-containing protein [Burkholderiales bacterium]|nr:NERD domain-containing protein [Burkholderiales bacterium]